MAGGSVGSVAASVASAVSSDSETPPARAFGLVGEGEGAHRHHRVAQEIGARRTDRIATGRARRHDVAQGKLRLLGDQRQAFVGDAPIRFDARHALEHRAVARDALADLAQHRGALALALAAFGLGDQIGDLVGLVAREGGIGFVARAHELADRQTQLGQAPVDLGGDLGRLFDRA